MSHSSDGNGGAHDGERTQSFRKDCSILVDVGDNKKISARSVIAEAVKLLGNDSILGIVQKSGNMYELTVSDKKDLDKLEDGLWINGRECTTTKIVQDTFVASMMYLPTYVSDHEIKSRLNVVGAELLSRIKRRYVEFDSVRYADGTRFCKVRLPQGKKSLPFTMKFSDGDTEAYYRVIHDGQCKTCSTCGSNEHLKKTCPQFICFQCGIQGHIKRFCTAEKCEYCDSYKCRCEEECEMEDEVPDEAEKETENDSGLCDRCGKSTQFCLCQYEAQLDLTEKNDDEKEIINENENNENGAESEIEREKEVCGITTEKIQVADETNERNSCDQTDHSDSESISCENRMHETVFGDVFDMDTSKTEIICPTGVPEDDSQDDITDMVESTGARKRQSSHSHITARVKIRATDPDSDSRKKHS